MNHFFPQIRRVPFFSLATQLHWQLVAWFKRMTSFCVPRYNVFSIGPLSSFATERKREREREGGRKRKRERESVLSSSPPRSPAYFSVSSLISVKLAGGVGVRLVLLKSFWCSKLHADGIFYLSGATPWRKCRRNINISKSSVDKEILYADMKIPVSQNWHFLIKIVNLNV